MWQFMDATRDTIGMQHRRLGASLDWSRLRFTMDEGSARAVRVAFTRLWDEGLAYRGEALVNWCPRCRTTISDLENIKHEETGTLWSLRYHLVGADGSPDPDAWITVATTRPETIFGDTAVAVHPEDERYADLVGREAMLPFIGRRRPDRRRRACRARRSAPAPVKITPAHDFDDYEVAKRHDLPMITVLDEDARLTDAAGEFAGLDRYDARPKIVDALRELGDLEAERPHEMVIGRCDRCGTVVEPRLSVQWFINVKPLAERALAQRARGTHPDHAGALREGVRPLDGEHPRLGGRSPAVVGPPDPGVVLPRRAHHGQRHRGRPGCVRHLRATGRGAHPGDRHLRHLVLERPVAVLHARLAGRDARTSRASTRPRSWRPPTRSCSSGSPG